MVHCIIAFVLFLGVLPLPAQQLSKMQLIGRPEKSTSEIVAVRDANGRFCAAIQVISDMDGFRYDSYNGVVKVDDQPGQDMVYLPPDERVLEIFKSGYKPLKLILLEIGIQLKPKEVWRIEIKGENKTGDLLPVTFLVNPQEVNLSVDGKPAAVGQPVQLLKSSHNIRISKAGYKTIDEAITVSENKVLFNYTLMEVDLQQVVIKSVPGAARIFIDNMDKGQTNKGFFLYPGTYKLKLTRTGYLDTEETIQVAETDNNEFSFSLLKNSGTLSLTINPADARVLLNREDYSGRTQMELAPGRYKIEISKSGYESASETITVERGQRLQRTYTLSVITGRLQFTVQPLDASVTLKRNNRTIRSWQGIRQMKDLPVGDYELQCNASGYAKESRRVTIIAGQAAVVDVLLKKTIPSGIRADMTSGNMVFVEGGTFQMGSTSGRSDEKSVHSVTVSSFYMSKYEVTQKEWQEVMGSNPSRFKGDNWPVEQVNWYDAVEFCNKKSMREGLTPSYKISGKNVTCDFSANGYRLPTEAEWEYAVRGGSKSRGYKYSGSNKTRKVAWYDDNSGRKTHPVGGKQPNELGFYDMSGNVWEWCWDWYDSDYYRSNPRNAPKGPDSGSLRVLRGGSWSNITNNVRSANRYKYNPGSRGKYYGFRCVQKEF